MTSCWAAVYKIATSAKDLNFEMTIKKQTFKKRFIFSFKVKFLHFYHQENGDSEPLLFCEEISQEYDFKYPLNSRTISSLRFDCFPLELRAVGTETFPLISWLSRCLNLEGETNSKRLSATLSLQNGRQKRHVFKARADGFLHTPVWKEALAWWWHTPNICSFH